METDDLVVDHQVVGSAGGLADPIVAGGDDVADDVAGFIARSRPATRDR